MTTQLATVPESDADVRWRKWQARGAENDRTDIQEDADIDGPDRRCVCRLVVVRSTRMRRAV